MDELIDRARILLAFLDNVGAFAQLVGAGETPEDVSLAIAAANILNRDSAP